MFICELSTVARNPKQTEDICSFKEIPVDVYLWTEYSSTGPKT